MPRSILALILQPNQRRALPRVAVAAALAWSATIASSATAINIQFDYRFDSTGFFGTEASPTPARTALEFAARTFEPFADDLAAIQPGGGNAWTAKFFDPPSGLYVEVPNLPVGANDLVVFAMGRDLAASTLGEASPGIFSLGPNPSPDFFNGVVNRGQGPAAVDFAPWGGVIRFDTHETDGAARPWHFGVHTNPTFPEFDFYSVAVHELTHILGFGTSSAFTSDVASWEVDGVMHREFVGSAAVNLYGGSVPLTNDGAHWGNAVTSPPFAFNAPRPALARSQSQGLRRAMTPLDYAALADTGWETPPELLGLPGDVDHDGDVDGGDYLAWQRGLGGFGGLPGDVNGDQLVDDVDGWIVRRFMGAIDESTLESGLTGAAVPEPGAASLFALGVWLAIGGRRLKGYPKKGTGTLHPL